MTDRHGEKAETACCVKFTLDYLSIQAKYMMHHFSLADAKAGIVLAYCGVMLGITFAGETLHLTWFGIVLLFVSSVLTLMAASHSVLAIIPQYTDTDSDVDNDNFSWMYLPRMKGFYADRILRLTEIDMIRGVADTMDALAVVLNIKYLRLRRSMVFACVGFPVHLFLWFVYR